MLLCSLEPHCLLFYSMTGSDDTSSDLVWLHCNECHRSFSGHNNIQSVNGSLRIIKSDLTFALTSCGHVYCDSCIRAHYEDGRFTCPACQLNVHVYRLDTSAIPKKLEAFLKSPTGLFEEAASVMSFQLNNANELIHDLRARVAQQKEMLNRAKGELESYKRAKERIAQLTEENNALRLQLAQAKHTPGSPAISIRPQQQSRLSIRSPMPPSPNLMSPRYVFPIDHR